MSSLSPPSSPANLPSAPPSIDRQNLQKDLQQSDRTYIRLALTNQSLVAIATDFVKEVLVVPNQRFTVMPNMARPVMGLLNHRSRVIWVVDLSELFGLLPLELRSPEHHLAILQAQGISLGLAIREVKGVIHFAPEQVESPLDHDLPSAMVPFLRGCVPQQGEQPLLILDAEAIAAYSA